MGRPVAAVQNLKTYSFTIVNRKVEATLKVRRDDIADDRLGVFKPFFAEIGRDTPSATRTR